MRALAWLKMVSIAALGAASSGCVSFRPVEPVIRPPETYRNNTIVPVEFVHPALVGVRCAERGAKFLMIPAVNANACADRDLITMPNPCQVVTGGWYAATLCHELAHANGWPVDHRGGSLLPEGLGRGETTAAARGKRKHAEKASAKDAPIAIAALSDIAPLEAIGLD